MNLSVSTCLGPVSPIAQWIISMVLPRHATDVGWCLGLILSPLLGVLVHNVIQDVHPLGIVTLGPLGNVEDVEIFC